MITAAELCGQSKKDGKGSKSKQQNSKKNRNAVHGKKIITAANKFGQRSMQTNESCGCKSCVIRLHSVTVESPNDLKLSDDAKMAQTPALAGDVTASEHSLQRLVRGRMVIPDWRNAFMRWACHLGIHHSQTDQSDAQSNQSGNEDKPSRCEG